MLSGTWPDNRFFEVWFIEDYSGGTSISTRDKEAFNQNTIYCQYQELNGAGLVLTETPVLPQRNTRYIPRHLQQPTSHPYTNHPMQLFTVVTPIHVPKLPSQIPISTTPLSLTQANIYSLVLNLKSLWRLDT